MQFTLPDFLKPDPKHGWTRAALFRAFLALTVVFGGSILALALIFGVWSKVTGDRMLDVSYHDVYDQSHGYTSSYAEPAVYGGGIISYDADMGIEHMARSYMPESDMVLSMPALYKDGGTDAEMHERTSYVAFFETALFKETCSAIAGLKPLDYVLFDYASENNSFCAYEFRVEQERAHTVADALRALEPRDFSVNTSTAGGTLEVHDMTRAYLERRLESLESTLAEVEDAYETLVARAVATGSVSELTAVITNRLSTVERLTREVRSIEEQLIQSSMSSDDVLEETLYEHFSVHVEKRVFIDTEYLVHEWRIWINDTIVVLNQVFLWLTLGLVAFALQAGVFVVFVGLTILALVFITKYFSRLVRFIWGLE